MTVLIVAAKIGIVATYVQTLLMLKKLADTDTHVNVKFDLLSRLSICVVIGMSLVSVIAAITESTYYFTLGLCVLSLVLAQLQRHQIIVAGDKYVLLSAKIVPIRDIKKMETGLYTLRVTTKDKTYKVYVPLTTRNTLQEKVYQKIGKK